MAAPPNRSLQIALTVPVAAVAIGLVLYPQCYVLIRSSPFVWLTLASTLILHFHVRPKWTEVGWVLLAAAALSSVSFFGNPYSYDPIIAVSLFGLSSLAILGMRAIWSEGSEHALFLWAFVPGVLFVGAGWLTPPILVWGERLRPKVFDLYLYYFDGSLGVQLSFLVGVAFKKWQWLHAIGVSYYLGLPILLATVYAAKLMRARKNALQALLAFLSCGPLGAIFYNIFPALGPIRLFHDDFPLRPLSALQTMHLFLEPVSLAGPRNAIPSLHMAWVLLAWWYSEGTSRIVRGVALSFVLFTVVATLGTGEHYFVDLVVAYPFTLFVLALFAFGIPLNEPRRLRPLAIGFAGTLLWLLLLYSGGRLFWLTPVIPWGLIGTTIGAVIILRRRLFVNAGWNNLESNSNPAFSTNMAIPLDAAKDSVPTS
jgi:hypothetical protein